MSDTTLNAPGSAGASIPETRRGAVRAAKIPRPAACGCGSAVAFDADKKEFFCVRCGAARLCTCLRSVWTSTVRPVNVA